MLLKILKRMCVNMRRYGISKKNPNPAWPYEQPAIVIPPGSNMAAIGRTEEINDSLNQVKDTGSFSTRNASLPIMGYMSGENKMYSRPGSFLQKDCSSASVSSYLCQNIGNYAKVEFLFGENTHVEKVGILDSVGKDFIVLTEAGTGTKIVCSTSNIKFINIYDISKR